MRKSIICTVICIGLFSARSFAQNTFPATGNVGIGTTSPNTALQVVGDVTLGRNGGSTWDFQSPSSDLRIVGSTSGANIDLIPLGGNVGIGTTAPQSALHTVANNGGWFQQIIENLGSGAGGIQLRNSGTGTSGQGAYLMMAGPNVGYPNYNKRFSLISYANGGAGTGSAGITISMEGTSEGTQDLRVINGPGGNPLFLVQQTGNVGVGTTNPGAKLEIDGNVKLTSGSGASITYADGTTQSTAWTGVLCGGDYAESVGVTGARKQYEPGDLIVVDPAHPGSFAKSSQPYSTLVAGIYSTKPGAIGKRSPASSTAPEIPMAMIGIVPAKVSAENGPIKPGDLLVTSSSLGYAMKGTDRARMPGAIVGKALGNLDSGRGTIDVVVTLQ